MKGCVATAPNGNRWVRRSDSLWELDPRCPVPEAPRGQGRTFLLNDCAVLLLSLTVTWPEPPEPGPSVWEGSVGDDGLGRYADVSGTWPEGLAVLVIRKDRVLSDQHATVGEVDAKTGDRLVSVRGRESGKYRTIVVLEAE